MKKVLPKLSVRKCYKQSIHYNNQIIRSKKAKPKITISNTIMANNSPKDEFTTIAENLMEDYLRGPESYKLFGYCQWRYFLREGKIVKCEIVGQDCGEGDIVETHTTDDGRYTYHIHYEIGHYMEMYSLHDLRQSEYLCVLNMMENKDNLDHSQREYVDLYIQETVSKCGSKTHPECVKLINLWK